MSGFRDVEVVITRETSAVTQAGFGKSLILSGEQEHPYTSYTGLESIAEDFGESTETYRLANRIFAQTPRPQEVAVLGVSYDSEMDDPTVLTSALNENAGEDFYFIHSTEQGENEILAISEWIDAQERMYFYSSDDPTIQEQLESDRTVPFIHTDPTSYPAAGWVGVCAPTEPGSITWKFKTINGILDPGYSTTEVNNIEDTGGNTYIRQGGILHTTPGQTSSGEWIDVIRSQDFVTARLREEVFRVLANAPKVPFTNAGIAMVTSAVESVLKTAYNNGIIADDEDGQPLYSVTAPKRHEVPVNDRANRTLPDVNFVFELAGAIHRVRVNGTIRV